MCASYGLGGGPYREEPVTFELDPLDERTNQARIVEWMQRWDGTAKITGKNARNLNPLIRVADAHRQLDFAWWWLHIGGAPATYSAFNSRDDKLTRNWAEPFKHRRALLPATWYNEKGTTFHLPGDELFAITAIYTIATGTDGSDLVTYSMVTRQAVADAARVNDRMPLILPIDFHDTWLDPQRQGDAGLVAEAQLASDELSYTVVSRDADSVSMLFD